MRIGILTYHFSENFGALMQAYGLRAWLQSQGHNAEFINYHPRYVEEGGDFDQPLNPKLLKKNVKILYLKLSTVQRQLFGNKEQSKMFTKFHHDVLGVVGPRLENQEQVEEFLATEAGNFDVIICGSDQIWNPSPQKGIDPVYFLAMKDAGQAKRVAYAPSFGRGVVDPKFENIIGSYIKHLDAVSVREASGVDIVKRISGLEVIAVPDPSILLGDFSKLIKLSNPIKTDQIFSYALRSGDGISQVANQAADLLGKSVLSPFNTHRRWKEIGETIYPSPSSWLATLNASSFVVTNSFHGTALSILCQKPFVTVGLAGNKSKLNERAKNLLNTVGLMDRFVDGNKPQDAEAKIKQDIDWIEVQKKVEILQGIGRGYLEQSLILERGTSHE